MYKVGIIGFGKMGMLHGALLGGTHQAKIIAVCDKSAVMRLGFKRIYKNVHVYSDAKKMLDKEQLDIVIVTTPTFNHKESVELAVEKGCAVFVEKPLAINAEQARYICTLAEDKKTVIQVGFCNRFLPSALKAEQLLRCGRIGNPIHVKAVMYIGDVFEEHTGWRYKPELSGGGALMDFGIHMIDLLVHYFGAVKSVRGEIKQLYSRHVEDEASAKIQFASGLTCEFETSWSKDAFRKSYTRMEIDGKNGKMILTDQTLEVFDDEGTKIDDYTYPDLYDGCFMDLGGLVFSYQMESFLGKVNKKASGGKTEGCTPEQALYVQEIVESIYQSAKNNCEVEVINNE